MLPLLLLLLCALRYCCCWCSCSFGCSTSCARWQIAGSLNLIPVFSFSSCKQDLFVVYSSAVLLILPPRFAYVLGKYGHARSHGERQPAAAKPPFNCNMMRSTCSSYNMKYYEHALVSSLQQVSSSSAIRVLQQFLLAVVSPHHIRLGRRFCRC